MSDGKTIIRSKRPLVYFSGDDIAISRRLLATGLSSNALGFFIRLVSEARIPGGAHADEYNPIWLELHFHRLAHRRLIKLPEGGYEPGEPSSVYVHVCAEFDPWDTYADIKAAVDHEEREELAIAQQIATARAEFESEKK